MREEEAKAGTNRNQLNAREIACIHLLVPDSGTLWLDELIRQRLVRDEKAKIVGPNSTQLSLFEGGSA